MTRHGKFQKSTWEEEAMALPILHEQHRLRQVMPH